MPQINWADMLVPKMNPLEIFIRGSAVYLSLFLMMRFVLKRQAGTVNFTDLLFVVLVADASQNAMAGEYRSIPDGLMLIVVLLFWDYALDWVSVRSRRVRHFLQPKAVVLIRDGELQRRNMRRELVTDVELLAEARAQGLETLHEVKHAYMEHNGHITIIPRQKS